MSKEIETTIRSWEWWDFCKGRCMVGSDTVDGYYLTLEMHGVRDSLSKGYYDGIYLDLCCYNADSDSEPVEQVAMNPWFPGNVFEIAGYRWTIEVEE